MTEWCIWNPDRLSDVSEEIKKEYLRRERQFFTMYYNTSIREIDSNYDIDRIIRTNRHSFECTPPSDNRFLHLHHAISFKHHGKRMIMYFPRGHLTMMDLQSDIDWAKYRGWDIAIYEKKKSLYHPETWMIIIAKWGASIFIP